MKYTALIEDYERYYRIPKIIKGDCKNVKEFITLVLNYGNFYIGRDSLRELIEAIEEEFGQIYYDIDEDEFVEFINDNNYGDGDCYITYVKDKNGNFYVGDKYDEIEFEEYQTDLVDEKVEVININRNDILELRKFSNTITEDVEKVEKKKVSRRYFDLVINFEEVQKFLRKFKNGDKEAEKLFDELKNGFEKKYSLKVGQFETSLDFLAYIYSYFEKVVLKDEYEIIEDGNGRFKNIPVEY